MNRDVCLLIEGGLLERLLECALREGAVFARVCRSSERRIRVETDAHSADVLMRLCKRYGLNCRMLRRGGCTAFGEQLRRRWTLLPGLLLCVLLCALFLSRLWLVEVQFTDSSADPALIGRIYACLEESGVHPAMAAGGLDSSLVQRQICAAIGEISYAGVRRQGIRLFVEVSLETPAPEVYTLSAERDLYAGKNGVIDSVSVYSGEACVHSGDTVLRGDLLIRGMEDKSKEETTPIGARGRVIARCWYEGTASAPLHTDETVRTGRYSCGSRLRLHAFALTLAEPAHYAADETEMQVLPIVGLFLPLQLEKSVCYETTAVRRSQNRAGLEEKLSMLARADALRKIASDCTDGYEIADSWTRVQIQNDLLEIRAVYEIYTDIAVTRDALIEEVY